MSTLPPLADLGDVARQSPTPLTASQTSAAVAALDSASVAVRAFCRRKFTLGTYTTRLRAKGNWLLLPQRPVVSVQSVSVMVWGTLTATVGWVWDGLDRVWLGSLGIVINLPEELTQAVESGVSVAEVSYTAGYVTVPDDVASVTAGVAARALSLPMGGALVSQSAGPFSMSVAPWAQGGPLGLSDADKTILRQYRRAAASVETRS